MAKNKFSFLRFLMMVAGICVCLGLFLLVVSALNLQRQVRITFGQPDPSLGDLRTLYLSFSLLLNSDDLTQPMNKNGMPQTIKIPVGETTGKVLERLESQGLIKNAAAFRNYLQYRGLDRTLQAGEHSLSPAMNALEIATELQDTTPNQITFVILAGWRLEEIAAALPTSGLEISSDIFLEATKRLPERYIRSFQGASGASCEGFFLPGSYELKRDLSAGQLVDFMLQGFDDHVSEELRQGFEKQGLTVFQAVTLASIVQKEAVLPEEMPVIASVFLNRLSIGMKLDSDPTVQYALGYNQNNKTWWKSPLQPSDLDVQSIYNTYANPGLPPGPISNPSLEALEAVANPAQTPYFYFRASCEHDGKHIFAQTYQEQIENACP
jgi:UPF0755 protein